MKRILEKYTKNCVVCQKQFFAKRSYQKYCSSACSKQANFSPKGVRVLVTECQNCGKEYEYTNKQPASKYCSKECAAIAQKLNDNVGRFRIFERDNFTCFYCGKISYKDGAELHVDHLLPRKSGGKSIAANLVTACVACNLEKSAMAIRNLSELSIEVKRRNLVAGLLDESPVKIAENRHMEEGG